MKVTSVGVCATNNQETSLTPELLASVGARYSRNNEGLEAILEKVDRMDQDKAVDSIFKMVDYGHRSIADMAPVAMFIDNISILLALKLWHLAPTAGGQESSTRYVKLDKDNIVRPSRIIKNFDDYIDKVFNCYNIAYDTWCLVAEHYPELVNIPDKTKADAKVFDRMTRNFAFDRSRYFLPMCCCTNVMMVMNARGWVDLIKALHSDLINESIELAILLTNELAKVTPRLIKHARFDELYHKGVSAEFNRTVIACLHENNDIHSIESYNKSGAKCQINASDDISEDDIVNDLMYHKSRYDYFGPSVCRTSVRFGWDALTIAELRDLNRHRTGTKTFTLAPVGSYFADDQVELLRKKDAKLAEVFYDLRAHGVKMTKIAQERLLIGDPSFAYYLPLGAQCSYEHITTADKFLYQCELRTGLGAHYTYAARMREVLELWHQKFPSTRNLIRPGTAEPE